ncbi:uncharacterized protein METZ01_LOCUS437475 [marine metagenome]|uniref:Uncharacterized protein n=1 Tax=marine metagenome TaxID=408172 RepID=A0A382YNM1_9ZZZZ
MTYGGGYFYHYSTYILGSFKATSKIVALLSQWRWRILFKSLLHISGDRATADSSRGEPTRGKTMSL